MIGPWRVSGGWWEASPDEGPGGWSREEWDVAVGGAVYRLYRDALREGWFVEGELD